jgi:hypothetical protein
MFTVIYSKATGRVRSFSSRHPSPPNLNTGPGEAKIIFSDDKYGLLPDIQALVSGVTGLVPDDLYAVINAKGEITHYRDLDPHCGDAIPGHTLVHHSKVKDR